MSLATLLMLAPGLLAVLYALGMVASAIAAMTKNTEDDKVAAFLVGLHDFLVKLLPDSRPLAAKRAPVAPAEQPPVVHSK